MKILTTALMLRFFLKKLITKMQWFGLLLLIIGVINVQLQYEPQNNDNNSLIIQNSFIGFLSVFLMCLTSAFAGKINKFFNVYCLFKLLIFNLAQKKK